ncbi:hypothetical protein RI367_002741 [Sorochytrium milnesiophthora]
MKYTSITMMTLLAWCALSTPSLALPANKAPGSNLGVSNNSSTQDSGNKASDAAAGGSNSAKDSGDWFPTTWKKGGSSVPAQGFGNKASDAVAGGSNTVNAIAGTNNHAQTIDHRYSEMNATIDRHIAGADAIVGTLAHAEAHAEARAEAHAEARAEAHAEARAEAHAEARAEAHAEARAEARVGTQVHSEAELRSAYHVTFNQFSALNYEWQSKTSWSTSATASANVQAGGFNVLAEGCDARRAVTMNNGAVVLSFGGATESTASFGSAAGAAARAGGNATADGGMVGGASGCSFGYMCASMVSAEATGYGTYNSNIKIERGSSGQRTFELCRVTSKDAVTEGWQSGKIEQAERTKQTVGVMQNMQQSKVTKDTAQVVRSKGTQLSKENGRDQRSDGMTVIKKTGEAKQSEFKQAGGFGGQNMAATVVETVLDRAAFKWICPPSDCKEQTNKENCQLWAEVKARTKCGAEIRDIKKRIELPTCSEGRPAVDFSQCSISYDAKQVKFDIAGQVHTVAASKLFGNDQARFAEGQYNTRVAIKDRASNVAQAQHEPQLKVKDVSYQPMPY